MKQIQVLEVNSVGERTPFTLSKDILHLHVQNTLIHKPGTAIFIDGVCYCRGYLKLQQITEIENELSTT